MMGTEPVFRLSGIETGRSLSQSDDLRLVEPLLAGGLCLRGLGLRPTLRDLCQLALRRRVLFCPAAHNRLPRTLFFCGPLRPHTRIMAC
jgi:hypothetical protein